MKVVLATGVPELDSAIEQHVTKAQFVGSALYKEAVVDVVERKSPNVIILSELLEGVLSTRELILTLRTRFPETRILFIFKEDNPKEKAFLYHWMVFDVFSGSFAPEDLEHSLFNPKEFKDVSHELDELKIYQKSNELVNIGESNFTNIDGNNYNEINGPEIGGVAIGQQIVAFWSVLDQSGKTFSAVNTSMMLATNKETKILLLDFNLKNPNIHLHFGFSDPDRNIGALYEDLHNGLELSKDTFNDYLIPHPTYPNLKILSGNILKMRNPSDEDMFDLFEKITDIAEKSNFSTIIVDTESGLRDLSVNIIKRANKILMLTTETPGSLYAIRRCFDTEVGPLVEKLVDRKKIIPVITQSHDETRANFKRALEATLEKRVGAIVDYSNDILESLYKGTPILAKKPPEDIYNSFVLISNLVHNNIFKNPISRPTPNSNSNKSTSNSKKSSSSLFGNLFKKKQ